ncbi:hypothetical protein DITRI_Ditri18aG0003900 [Diplodiscus trichospermus]
MAKYSSQVFRTSILGEPTAVFCGAAGNKFLFSNENKLVTAWFPNSVNKIFPSSTQKSSIEESKKMRKLLPNFLKPEALQRYVGMMDAIAQRHFETGWEGSQEVAVFPLAKNYTFWVACKVFLSIEDPKHVIEFSHPFNVLASGIISIPIDLPGTPFNCAIKASNYMNELDIADKILGLLVGGHDTASAVMTFIVKYLAELPDIYHKVLTEQIEIAKLKAPGELLNWEDIKKMRYSWNVACELYWSVNSTHRIPEYFPEPEKIEPSRFEGNGPPPYTYVPFGGGPRMCPGKEYALLEILVFMHNIVKRYNGTNLFLMRTSLLTHCQCQQKAYRFASFLIKHHLPRHFQPRVLSIYLNF